MIDTARDIMTINPRFVDRSTTLTAVARLMRDLDIGVVPVCDDTGKLVGVVTDRDIVLRCVADEADPRTTTVGDVATDSPVTISADAPVDDVLNTMADHQIRSPAGRRGRAAGRHHQRGRRRPGRQHRRGGRHRSGRHRQRAFRLTHHPAAHLSTPAGS